MGFVDRSRLRERTRESAGAGAEAALVQAIASALDAAEAGEPRDIDRAVEELLCREFHARMSAISEAYFGEEWALETAYGIWGRLTDDPRIWGYGSEEELVPLRWLADASGCWYDGKTIVPLAAWEIRYDAWAENQVGLVRRTTPEALSPDLFRSPLE